MNDKIISYLAYGLAKNLIFFATFLNFCARFVVYSQFQHYGSLSNLILEHDFLIAVKIRESDKTRRQENFQEVIENNPLFLHMFQKLR